MNKAPFSVTMIIYAVILAGAVVGGVLAVIFSSLADSLQITFLGGIFGGALAAFIAGVLAGELRVRMVKDAVSGTDLEGKAVPMAYSKRKRYAIIAGLAIVFAFLLMRFAGMELGFLTGAGISILTTIGAVVIFSTRMLTK